MTDNKIISIIFWLINGIVLYNSVFHEPTIGYDSPAHIINIKIISEFRLPAKSDTYLYYMPPLFYLLPALINSLNIFPVHIILKFVQLVNFALSLGVTFFTLKVCELIRPNNNHLKIFSLIFLGIMPVYYKTFAFIRTEPLLTFIFLLVVYSLIKLSEGQYLLKYSTLTGIYTGLAILTRHSGIILFFIITTFMFILLIKNKQNSVFILKSSAIIFSVAVIIGGWFYFRSYELYKNPFHFNRELPDKISLSNQHKKFYLGLGDGYLFSNPVRDFFPNQFLPILYSDFWGDYWCYFVIYGKDKINKKYVSGLKLKDYLSKYPSEESFETNYYQVQEYLAEVNFVSLYPTFIMLAGFLLGTFYLFKLIFLREHKAELVSFSLIQLLVFFSFLFFFCFSIVYPSLDKGGTIKPSYMLHAFPFIAILSGELLYKLKQKLLLLSYFTAFYLLYVALHNSGVLTTSYK